MWFCKNDNPDTQTWFKPSLFVAASDVQLVDRPHALISCYQRGSANANYLPTTELAILRNANIRGK